MTGSPLAARLLGAALVAAAVGLSALAASAAETVWRMPTEYPASAIPGEGIAAFAAAVAAGSGGRLAVEPSYDAALGFRSADMPGALRSGTIEAGDMFGGAVAALDPLFELSSLPFVVGSQEEAHRLAERARASYERAWATAGQHLLYVTPWPPSGLWSKQAVAGPRDIAGLAVRTYDATSTAVLTRAGARAVGISFADAQARIRDGTLDAVLSSGDGGAGRRLWESLPHFTALDYAIPLSFAVVSRAAYERLDPELRRAVDTAAAATEQRQWSALTTRLAENYARMRQNGVTIRTSLDPELGRVLREAGREAVADWARRAGPEAAALVAPAARP